MKAYGLRKGDDVVDDQQFGCASKHRKVKNRKAGRRLLHKQARRDAKKDLEIQNVERWCD